MYVIIIIIINIIIIIVVIGGMLNFMYIYIKTYIYYI